MTKLVGVAGLNPAVHRKTCRFKSYLGHHNMIYYYDKLKHGIRINNIDVSSEVLINPMFETLDTIAEMMLTIKDGDGNIMYAGPVVNYIYNIDYISCGSRRVPFAHLAITIDNNHIINYNEV
jgi:hypothetical protein